MQNALAAFMTHSGPDDVVLYNFGTMATQVKVKKGNELVKRIRYHAERDDPFHDSWALLRWRMLGPSRWAHVRSRRMSAARKAGASTGLSASTLRWMDSLAS
jgi:hypothetical protein